jgi:excinuclease ABC subunit C
VLKGPEVIARAARMLPNKPGVYRMVDAKGSVLYVGKARNLKAGCRAMPAPAATPTASPPWWPDRRHGVRDHRDRGRGPAARGQPDQAPQAALQRAAARRQVVSLYPDRREHRIAQLAKHRGARAGKGSYYGPFASAGAVNRTINALQKAFLLRSCSDSVYENRTRPCLLYQIKRCSAPCTGEIGLDDYDELVRSAKPSCRGARRRSSRARPAMERPPSSSTSSRPPATATALPP